MTRNQHRLQHAAKPARRALPFLCACVCLTATVSCQQLGSTEITQRSQSPTVKTTENNGPKPTLPRNFTMKTLGGRQFWGDVAFFHDWKIQQNTITGHYRLLDGDDYRHASGSMKTCRAKLEQVKKQLKLPPMKGEAVIVIHGITRSSKSLSEMQTRLRDEGYTVFAFGYPSTCIDIPQSASYLRQAIDSLEGIEKIHLVVHSMGGLVVRSYASGKPDKRIGRLVMIGVPNKGAWLADKLKDNPLYKMVYGPAGQQLVSTKDGFVHKLPIPRFPFAVIAGARGTPNGYNPLQPGDDDGTVAVESARLPGATDFMTVKAAHSFQMRNTAVINATVRFLKTGRLRKKGKPRPIPIPDADAAKPFPKPTPAGESRRATAEAKRSDG